MCNPDRAFKLLDSLNTQIPVQHEQLHQDTHSYFSKVDPIIQRVPGTLLVIWSPGLLEDLADAFPFFTFESVTSRDTRRPRDAIGPRVTVSTGVSCWPLHAAAILGSQEGEGVEWDNNLKIVYYYLTSTFFMGINVCVKAACT